MLSLPFLIKLVDLSLGALDLLDGSIKLRICYLKLFRAPCEHMFRFPLATVGADIGERIALVSVFSPYERRVSFALG